MRNSFRAGGRPYIIEKSPRKPVVSLHWCIATYRTARRGPVPPGGIGGSSAENDGLHRSERALQAIREFEPGKPNNHNSPMQAIREFESDLRSGPPFFGDPEHSIVQRFKGGGIDCTHTFGAPALWDLVLYGFDIKDLGGTCPLACNAHMVRIYFRGWTGALACTGKMGRCTTVALGRSRARRSLEFRCIVGFRTLNGIHLEFMDIYRTFSL